MSKNLDEIADKDILKKLETFGLSDKEARVYLALLPRQNPPNSLQGFYQKVHVRSLPQALVDLSAEQEARSFHFRQLVGFPRCSLR